MGTDKNIAPDFKVPIPFIPEDEKEADPSYGKPPSVKLLLDYYLVMNEKVGRSV
jgi:hypothetical protein